VRLAGDREIEVLELEGDPERRALVLLHEGLGSVGLWRGFPRALAEATGRRLIAFSRFGHGRSQPPAGPRTPAFFHEEALDVLPAVLEDLHAPEPILVGHSDGGSIALIHAAQRPVTGVVLIAPHVVVEEMTLAAIRRTRAAYATDGLRERMARHHDDPDAAFWGWCDVWLDPAFPEWSIEEEAGDVTAPLLLVQGADDPYGTIDQIDRIESRARGETQRLVVAGGHSPHLEQPDAVVARIADFAAGLP
jgi:pimeloyl-ACP methyl ester carboxylesterase